MNMRKKHLWICFFVTFLICTMLTGCGSSAPDESLIESDLNDYLADLYGDDYEFTTRTTVKSITEGSTYNATMDAVAEGTYARLNLTIDLQYTKYDQGWQSDYIDMYLDGYEIVNYPTESEIYAMCDERNSSRPWEVAYTDYELSDDVIVCYGNIDVQYNEYFDLKGDATTYWNYSLEENQWVANQEYLNCYGVLAYNIEGSFKIHNGTGSRIYVRNQTETSMEILDSSEEEEWVTVELQTYGNNITTSSLQDGLMLTYVGYLSDGEKVTVEVSYYRDFKFQIKTNFQYSMFDSWGYLDTFIPAE